MTRVNFEFRFFWQSSPLLPKNASIRQLIVISVKIRRYWMFSRYFFFKMARNLMLMWPRIMSWLFPKACSHFVKLVFSKFSPFPMHSSCEHTHYIYYIDSACSSREFSRNNIIKTKIYTKVKLRSLPPQNRKICLTFEKIKTCEFFCLFFFFKFSDTPVFLTEWKNKMKLGILGGTLVLCAILYFKCSGKAVEG